MFAMRRAAVALLGGIALTAVVAGCGGSDDGDSTSPASTSTPAAATEASTTAANAGANAGAATCGDGSGKAATGTPIKVGAIVTQTGGVDFSSASNGARAYFSCLNANGGINGSPVDYIVADDGNDPQKSAAAAARLVNDEKVVAMVGNQSFTDCLVNTKTYAAQDVLSLMAVGLQGPCFQSPQIIPMNAGPQRSNISTAQVAQEDGKKKLALIVLDVPGVKDFVESGVKAFADAHGMELVKTVGVAPGIKDATGVILGVKSAGPDAVIISTALPDTVALMKAAQQQQLTKTAPIYCPTSCYDAALPKLAGDAADGTKINIEFAPLDATTPDTLLWSQTMDKYESGKTKDSFSQGGFLAAKLFADSLKGTKTIDRATVKKAITAQSDYTTDLVCKPFDLSVDGSKGYNPNIATRQVEVTDGAYKEYKPCFDAWNPATGS